ncbi:phosphogluconate dehydrogenase (NAD(+)-dependent, decarboxylating) [Thiohalomonas denitrificans]|uniref:6-phosphogluconate dehydrogenase n=1 Tax=Thiohalomonas denitrificans TaxID=415747 RepID=A0A1G5Q079_9GAMM|nr:decarboxylating 6-phosphogluconate dehydrogenase [Thiohalomonas denitrificans]SCZ55183.1 6-phosphogluconate dehydrogenase [Thiohalomonas denitrificans]
MRIAIIGLGRMGANMARRLAGRDIKVIGYNRSPEVAHELAREEENITAADSVAKAIGHLSPPRVVWLMLPAGAPTEDHLRQVAERLEPGDLIVDGANSNFHDTRRRGEWLEERSIGFVDAGTSGGIWGLENGYCLMVGGEKRYVELIEPALKALAPAPDRGWAHVGPVGAGHYTKMIHNGIEYGMMQALAEGLALLRSRDEFGIDLAQVSEVWRHGSVVQSWLLDLTADALARDQSLEAIQPVVSDSGEGRWTAIEAVEQGVPAPVMTLALQMRFASQDQEGYPARLLSVMRNAFGGHVITKR